MLNRVKGCGLQSGAKVYTLNTPNDVIVETIHTEEGIDCYSVFYNEPFSTGGLYTVVKNVLFPSGERRDVEMHGDWWNSNSTVLSHFTGKKYKCEQLKLFGNLGYLVLVEEVEDNGAQHD